MPGKEPTLFLGSIKSPFSYIEEPNTDNELGHVLLWIPDTILITKWKLKVIFLGDIAV